MFSNCGNAAQFSGRQDRELLLLAARHRRLADLTGGDLEILRLNRRGDIAGADAECGHLHRIEPDPHRILSLTEDVGVTHARYPRNQLLEMHIGVIRNEDLIVFAAGRVKVDRQHEIAGGGADRQPLLLHLGRQLCQGELHPVLHVDLIDVRIAADRESDVQM